MLITGNLLINNDSGLIMKIYLTDFLAFKYINVKILLLTPPAFESYRMNLNPEQLDITIKTTTEICSKYDNCIYQNLLGDSNFVATDFFDADHLSEIGAKKLSEFIDKIILEWK